MTTLDELALKYGTDKASGFHNYCPIYERYFAELRHTPVALLELGVYRGASLRMWREYFDNPSSYFWGVDYNTGCCVGQEDRLEVFRIDQEDPRLANELLADYPLNIVVDDCSHRSDLTIASFKNLWPLVVAGGFYVVEDLWVQPEATEFLREVSGATIERGDASEICFIRKEADG